MTNAIQWLSENKTWLFDGIGALIVIGVAGWLFRRFRAPEADSTRKTQRARAGTSVQQAGRDTINVNAVPRRHPPTLRVLAHRAYFVGETVEHFFIKIVNTTPDAQVEVTHVWYQDGQRVEHILSRPLPVRLRPNETWETFEPVANIPQDADVFRHFHATLSTGERFASEHNANVPPVGYVAG